MNKVKLLKISLIITSVLSFNSCGSSSSNDNIIPTSLIKKWETTQTNQLDTPESVIYDTNKNVMYVSNVNSSTSKKNWSDNDGFISKLNKKGEIETLLWASHLKAPKGLAIHDNYLYVADLDTVVKINTSDGIIEDIFAAPSGADHLNDITYDTNRDILYVSESRDDQIFEMTLDGTFTLLYDKELDKPRQNGLYFDNGNLIMQGKQGSLKLIDLDTNKATIISDSMDNTSIDGIWKYNNRGYLVSNWSGKIYFVNLDGTSTLLLSTNPIRSADISYSSNLGLLLVPNFDDKIIAYEVK